MKSPYASLQPNDWQKKTQALVGKHPINQKELVEVVLSCWESIFESRIGKKGFRIGEHIFPKPQIMGFLLHELIPLEFAWRYPQLWRAEHTADDKDLVYIPDGEFSVEIKTSSDKSHIYGNRSYAQETSGDKKSKSGYYLAVNFEKFDDTGRKPQVTMIRFGWLDHTDWLGQAAASGQQARLSARVEHAKLLTLFPS